ncbi:tRNA (adenine(22)-N(1))-methyltransferase [[Mycoplasma] testudinis]|uniref:tRNA (adenine(22)-N(1))-methyltransferase n=1 Tax=[Mycoplasma] testudinis TaxID=33924 RepID=UPI00069845FE|nr:class I SAM-dependent methyltransferase [[Mycoplasma] testudinis]
MTKKINHLISFIKKPANLVIDVGCDHGYLSLALLQMQHANFIVNIDNKHDPLKSAINNLIQHNFLNKTANIINEGLSNLPSQLNPDYVVIAGMGTFNIITILQDNPIQKVGHFILQPEGHLDELRKWLFKNNYLIENEKIIEVDNRFYTIILCTKNLDEKIVTFKDEDIYLGPILKHQKDNKLFNKYLKLEITKLKKIAQRYWTNNTYVKKCIIERFLNESQN